jgi:hypothetical protein
VVVGGGGDVWFVYSSGGCRVRSVEVEVGVNVRMRCWRAETWGKCGWSLRRKVSGGFTSLSLGHGSRAVSE